MLTATRPPRLLLLDTASLYYRAYYGVPETVRASDGTPVNALRGLLDIMTKLIGFYEPTHIVACWDNDWRPQWRVDLIPSYKSHRVAPPMSGAREDENGEDIPEGLAPQLPLIREALQLMQISVVGADGFEADDVIGTFVAQATMPVDIVTGDRDLFQLVDDARDIRVIYTARGMSNLSVITNSTISEKYAINATQYVDFAVLRGDASDGLPGVRGVGDKTAASLLARHGTLDAVVAAAAAEDGMSASIAKKISASTDYLSVAPRVVAVACDIPLEASPSPLAPLLPDEESAVARFGHAWSTTGACDRLISALSTY